MRSKPMTSQEFLSIDNEGGAKKMHLDEEVVSSYLESDEVADKPVVVISVAGAFRTGKSFLLNSMTRYLTASDKSRWLEDKSDSFPWKSGCNAHTNGMSMSHPIPVTLQSGEEAVLLLLDTQGIFDDNSTAHDSTRIFALSTLLSSVQVFNVMSNLKGDDLDNLQLFAEYGQLAMDNSEGKPFQDLVFVIRDWHHTHDYALGGQGGNDLVKQRLNSNRETLAQRRQHIKACFTDISGFLLPPPGEAVAGSPTFAGDPEDMEPKFIKALEDLMSTLLCPEKLSVKMNGNRPMTCRQLAVLIKTYTDLFQSEELPDAKGILQTVAEATNMAAVNDKLRTYMRRMNGLLGEDAPMLHEELLREKQKQAKAEALKSLELQKTMKDPTKSENHYSRLLSDNIEDWLKTSQNLFTDKCKRDELKATEANKRLVDECLGSFDESMNSVKSDKPIGENKIRESYEAAKQVALHRFNGEVVTLGSYSGEESRARLEETMKKKLALVLESDEENANTATVHDEFQRYKTRMNGLLSGDAQPIDEGILFDEQAKARTEVLEALKSKLTVTNSTKLEKYSHMLAGKIEDWFNTSKELFTKKCKQDKRRALEANKTLVDECLDSFDESMNSVKSDKPIGENKIRKSYETAKQVALHRFNGEVVTLGSYSGEESRARLEETMKEKLALVLESDEENANTATVHDEFQRYKTRMNGLLRGDAQPIDEGILFDEQAKARTEVLEALKSKLTVTNSTKLEKYSRMLADKIEDWFNTSKELFTKKCKQDKRKALEANKTLVDECLSAFDKYVDSVKSDKPIGEEKIRQTYGKSEQIAFKRFNTEVVTFGSYSAEESRLRLEKTMKGKLTMMLERDEKNANKAAVSNEFLRYKTRMESLLGEEAPMLDEGLLSDEHNKAIAEALDALKPQLTIPGNHYSRLLVSEIEDWFKGSGALFNKKCEQDRLNADQANKTLSDKCVSSFSPNEDEIKNEAEVDQAIIQAKEEALQLFDAEVVTYGSYSAEDIRETLEKSLKVSSSSWREDYENRQYKASIATGLKVTACILGTATLVAAGPVGWGVLAAAEGTVAASAAAVAAAGAVAAGGAAGIMGTVAANIQNDAKKKETGTVAVPAVAAGGTAGIPGAVADYIQGDAKKKETGTVAVSAVAEAATRAVAAGGAAGILGTVADYIQGDAKKKETVDKERTE